ncbi:1-aminocyclopropane-1-carboxylate deaminase/D-cysteine desulfhydrase [Mucilaginibacter hurinus]|uniref:1-aminocyclopropane-1-carboxylate deaminase/D-cysteine desulfhydrase n=1 Tax=Mucilaginibacter hurinus TaxID=2201324 RepID=A0A367GST0_9SPHI|nr:pyridoxal-phosphate dependent enzyme [Mucilaginibacter hurinus]RCH56484.1 1-aminocyclopropane-1-carboxylate deaminase/D-cysteine desulfhydrase [Mucilaginibacter hurinus]
MPVNLNFFSPVEQIKNAIFDEHGVEVFIKRDDLIHPFISGNKWRKLKYILREAQAKNKTHLVTFGGAYANHLLATAAAAAKFGFKATGIVRGEQVFNDTLFLCSMHGMQLLFTNRDSYRDKAGLFTKHFGDDTTAFFVDEGGACEEGARGCSELITELSETYDDIICAGGTGTTGAGIINGILKHQLNTRMHIIPVLKNGEFLRPGIDKYLAGPAEYHLHTAYHFGGYAKVTPALVEFIKQFTSSTGIMLEPVYTGKMMYALFNLIEKGHFKKGSRILAVHTGGLLGILGMKERFNFTG